MRKTAEKDARLTMLHALAKRMVGLSLAALLAASASGCIGSGATINLPATDLAGPRLLVVAPHPDDETHTATDSNRTDTRVMFMGQYGDQGCGPSTVTLSNVISPVYRFTIIFPTNSVVPTNAYPITLSGFDP